MTLTNEIRDRIEYACAEAKALGEFVILRLSANGKAAAKARDPKNMRRGGRTKAERSAYMSRLAKMRRAK